MRISTPQIEHLVRLIFQQWKQANLVTFKESEEKVFQRAVKALQDEVQKELNLDAEVNRMLDELERTHAGEFQRFKMYPILKQKLAKEKKIVL